MSKRKMIAGSLLTLVMVLSCMMFGMTSVAFADTDYYDYTVKMFGGNQGTVTTDEVTYSSTDGKDYGTWDYSDYDDNVTVNGDKYYFKGYHIAGQEKIVTNIKIDKDYDLVASYGIKGDDVVAYTVTFEDGSGNELHASQTYYGKIGEKPVVSYLYIDGYTPQALALTKTLDADESQNVFPFVYTEGSVDNGGSTTGGEGTGEGGATTGGGTATGGTTAGGAAAGAGDAGAAGGAGADDGAAAIDDDAAPQTQPADVVDLDDDDTPLAPGDADEQDGEKKGGLGAGLYLGIGIGIAAIIAAIAALLRRRGNDEAAGE